MLILTMKSSYAKIQKHLKRELFQTREVLFQPRIAGMRVIGLHQAVSLCIDHCYDVELTIDEGWYETVVLAGVTACFPGVADLRGMVQHLLAICGIHLFDINILGNITFEELKTLTVGDIAVIAEIGDLWFNFKKLSCKKDAVTAQDVSTMLRCGQMTNVVQSTGNTT
ncbi:hypothetical protein Tco_0400979 [Tanacetum coccineum]